MYLCSYDSASIWRKGRTYQDNEMVALELLFLAVADGTPNLECHVKTAQDEEEWKEGELEPQSFKDTNQTCPFVLLFMSQDMAANYQSIHVCQINYFASSGKGFTVGGVRQLPFSFRRCTRSFHCVCPWRMTLTVSWSCQNKRT